MTPAKLAKIRAIANDARGDPATRAVAQAVLRRYAQPESEFHDVPPPRDPRHPGMRTSPEYDRRMFLDLTQWGETHSGNPIHTTNWKGVSYVVVLFQHKKTPTYGWMRTRAGQQNGPVTFSETKYRTQSEAHRAAWESLQTL